ADALLGGIESRLPEGPRYYPEGTVTDQPDTFVAAELVREKLLAVARDELPHSITVSVDELEDGDDPEDEILRLRAEITVERDSQRGMVIGRGGGGRRGGRTHAPPGHAAPPGARVEL